MTSVAEHVLVQDALAACSALQGGRLLRWSESSGRYTCSGAADVPTAQQQLLGRTAELGWLLRTIEKLSAELAGLQPPSVVHEALVAAARREVGSYYRLVAILEAQAQQASGGSGGSGSGSSAPPDSVLTLRRLQVWLAEPLGRLRVLASCLEAVRGVRGGQALNALLALSKHGDPLVRKVVAPALEEACVPYFKQISLWVLNGTLEAGSSEFLVAREALPPPLCDDPAACWRGGYRLNPAMQPRFISDQLAGDILTTGKTIAFLREFCGDTRWAAAIGAPAQALAAGGGNYRQLRCVPLAVATSLLAGKTPGSTHGQALGKPFGCMCAQILGRHGRCRGAPQRSMHTLIAAAHRRAPLALSPLEHASWLESAVGDVKRAVSAHLLDIVMSQQGLPRHLAAIKRYLLMGQGDFVRVLLDAAQPELDKGAKEVSQYTLQARGRGKAPVASSRGTRVAQRLCDFMHGTGSCSGKLCCTAEGCSRCLWASSLPAASLLPAPSLWAAACPCLPGRLAAFRHLLAGAPRAPAGPPGRGAARLRRRRGPRGPAPRGRAAAARQGA